MMRRSVGYGSLLFLLLTGFSSRPTLQRLGPDPAGSAPLERQQAAQAPCEPTRGGRLRLDGETRSTLPRCVTQVQRVQFGAGCRLHVGLANLGTDEPLRFEIAFKLGTRGFVEQAVRVLAPAPGWTDLELAVEADQALQQLRFSVSGRAPQQGVFSRPLLSCPSARSAAVPRSVLLISLDTLRADRLGAYGNPDRLTPNLDRIAQQGTLFLQAYAQYPDTHGSHAALFTGEYSSRVGMVGTFRPAALRAHQATLASALAARGYVTLAVTEDAFVGSAYGFDRGFDRYHDGPLDHAQGHASTTFRRALDWLRERPAQPFFMFLHT